MRGEMGQVKSDYLRRERDREIYRLYKESRELMPSATHSQLLNVLAVLPAPSFYIDAETCAKFLSLLLRGRDLSEMPPRRREIYYTLYRNYALMRSEGRTQGRPLVDVAEELVGMPAPSFWLTWEGLRKIVLTERRRERRRLYERVK